MKNDYIDLSIEIFTGKREVLPSYTMDLYKKIYRRLMQITEVKCN